MPSIFFTADTHLGHNRIIQYCTRPFPSHQEMDEILIQRTNELVRAGDVLWHLGDVAWSSYDIHNQYLKRLNTKEVHLVLGNHDTRELKVYKDIGFRTVQDYCKVSMDRVRGTVDIEGTSRAVALFHYPIRSWSGKSHGGFHLYGHCHGKVPGEGRSMDVGVDTNRFYPWAWEEIRERLKELPVFYDSPQEKD